jgi:hypothetical protein
MAPRTVLPTLTGELIGQSSDIWLAAGIFAVPASSGFLPSGWQKHWSKVPVIPASIASLEQ